MRNRKLYALGSFFPVPARRLVFGLFAAVLATSATPVLAATPALASVEAVQWPVWIERDGVRRPVDAGETLKAEDRLLTGEDGRLLLRLADGSGVKLGERAQLAVGGLDRGGGVLNAAFAVTRGAFRFTTGLFQQVLKKRAVTVNVATITAGIRGTDLWGKSDEQRDLVCLLEGRISVTHPMAVEPKVMDQANTFFAADRGRAPAGVVPVDPVQVKQWAVETEVVTGGGVGRSSGFWQVRLARVETQAAALAIVDQSKALGFPAGVRVFRDSGGLRYEVRILRLASEAEALRVAGRLSAALKLADVAVRR